MKEANLNVNGVTPLMHNALIAQYDAIAETVKALGNNKCDQKSSTRCEYLCDVCYWLSVTVDCAIAAIAKHDPRKGAE